MNLTVTFCLTIILKIFFYRLLSKDKTTICDGLNYIKGDPLELLVKKTKICLMSILREERSDLNRMSSLFDILGFRYELYCASKASKTTQVTLHCDIR